VSRFYSLIDARNFEAAWSLLSPQFQAGVQYERWIDGYAATRSVVVTSLSTVSQNTTRATVEVSVVAIDDVDGRPVRKIFQGTWAVVLLAGEWRLDRGNIRQVT
jgi:hypothetical protein